MEVLMEQALRAEAVNHLRTLIRCDTSNPPGGERPAAEYIAQHLTREGVEAQVLEKSPRRSNVVARLPGTGEAAPLLLLSHLDVVPARSEEWSHHPFSGDLADGYVWGRGAVDMKNTTAIQMTAMSILARQRVPLKRDLLLAATAGEEADPEVGVIFLADAHPEWVTAEYALNESGGEALLVGGKRFYTLQIAQKMGMHLNMVALGPDGHSSIPYERSAISTLAEAVTRLKEQPLPHRVTNTTRRFFQEMAAAVEDERQAGALLDMLDPARQAGALDILDAAPFVKRMFWSMMRNIAEPTILRAGYKRNVIPASAEAEISARNLPGVGPSELLGEIQPVVGDDVQLHPGRFYDALEFDIPDDDPLYQAARYAIQRHDPEGILVPYLSCGGTDAPFLAPLGVKTLGFTPMQPDPAGLVLQLAHSSNERISVENLSFGTQVLLDTILHLNGASPYDSRIRAQ